MRRRSYGISAKALWSCLSLALSLAAAGCSHRHHSPPAFVKLYSPTGEPLNGGPLGEPSCAAAYSAWFERVDRDHDGSLDRDEFLAEARRQFAVMDLDGDGMITPAELAQYRAPYEAGQSSEAASSGDQGSQSGGRSSRRRKRGGGGGDGGSAGDQPDPVMAADTTFHNRVSLEDFMAYAGRRFATLDAAGQGRLTKADLLRLCAS